MNETKHFEWNGASYRARLAKDVKHRGYTLTTKAAHLMIEAGNGVLSTRIVMFGEKGRRVADRLLPFTPDEIRGALGLSGGDRVADEAFARSIGADRAVPGKFAIKGRKLEVFCDIEGKVHVFLFFLSKDVDDEVVRLVGRYMDHHFPRR